MDDAGAYSQPQAGPSKLARNGSVGLLEGIKDQLPLFLWNADAGIGNCKSQLDFQSVLPHHLHAQYDFAYVGELYGIANQIDQHLFQARCIADQMRRNLRRQTKGDLQLFLVGLQSHGPGSLGYGFCQLEVAALELQLAGFDLREIQNIVDHDQQGIGRILGHAH